VAGGRPHASTIQAPIHVIVRTPGARGSIACQSSTCDNGLVRVVVLVVLVALGGQAFADEVSETRALRGRMVGRAAPAFDDATVLLPRGEKLASNGKVVVLEFWASWCAPCIQVLPRLAEWHRRYARKGLRIVALTNEDRKVVSRFVAAHRMRYTVALMADDRIPDAYDVRSIPMFVVIDRAGVVRHVEVGATADLDRIEDALPALLGAPAPP
jgi:thiol-disulfide isomerase/thioredoxin